MEEKALWQSKYRFPTAIGVPDCTFRVIEKPELRGDDEYVNRNGNTTLNVQVTCDAKGLFTIIDVSCPGAVYDARIWKNRETVSRTRNTVIIADDGYGIEP
ncbi:hypothetical protein J437_LFUL009292 [Ladona fulva]|uniref:DDE Tnp4 domain-containing protein n=1 Tax=Ladona fulva TaxID=123851 RepID=A0A8K0K577_LADFU|nr:hypothetical protein J437_LFUL009292 [Ladona fulva]